MLNYAQFTPPDPTQLNCRVSSHLAGEVSRRRQATVCGSLEQNLKHFVIDRIVSYWLWLHTPVGGVS